MGRYQNNNGQNTNDHNTNEMVRVYWFLASPDALEVMLVTDWLTELLSVSTDLTDVTLVSDDTYWRLDWCYSNNWGYWLMNFPKIFLKNLRIFRKSDNLPKIWQFSENLRIFHKSENFLKIWEFSKNLKMMTMVTMMKVIKWWKLSSDESYQVMKVI